MTVSMRLSGPRVCYGRLSRLRSASNEEDRTFPFLTEKNEMKKIVRLKTLTLTHARRKTKLSCSSFQQFSLQNAPQHLVRIHHDKPDIQAASFPKFTLQTDLHNHLKILKELPSPGQQPLATLSPLTFPLSVSPFFRCTVYPRGWAC